MKINLGLIDQHAYISNYLWLVARGRIKIIKRTLVHLALFSHESLRAGAPEVVHGQGFTRTTIHTSGGCTFILVIKNHNVTVQDKRECGISRKNSRSDFQKTKNAVF
jgi:hypothetical protein